jgi:hypothetical protein
MFDVGERLCLSVQIPNQTTEMYLSISPSRGSKFDLCDMGVIWRCWWYVLPPMLASMLAHARVCACAVTPGSGSLHRRRRRAPRRRRRFHRLPRHPRRLLPPRTRRRSRRRRCRRPTRRRPTRSSSTATSATRSPG